MLQIQGGLLKSSRVVWSSAAKVPSAPKEAVEQLSSTLDSTIFAPSMVHVDRCHPRAPIADILIQSPTKFPEKSIHSQDL